MDSNDCSIEKFHKIRISLSKIPTKQAMPNNQVQFSFDFLITAYQWLVFPKMEKKSKRSHFLKETLLSSSSELPSSSSWFWDIFFCSFGTQKQYWDYSILGKRRFGGCKTAYNSNGESNESDHWRDINIWLENFIEPQATRHNRFNTSYKPIPQPKTN